MFYGAHAPMYWEDYFPVHPDSLAIGNAEAIAAELGNLSRTGGQKRMYARFEANFYIERWIMATKRKGTKENGSNESPLQLRPATGNVERWVNVTLDDSDNDRIAGFDYDVQSIGAGLLSRCLAGWDITVKFDIKSNCWAAYAMGYVAGAPSTFVGISARSSDPIYAALALLYKLDLLDERGLPAESRSDKPKFW